MSSKIAKLIMVAVDVPGGAAQSNKFYNMTLNDSTSTIEVEYGRVEKTCIKETYPASMWDKKLKEKLDAMLTETKETRDVLDALDV